MASLKDKLFNQEETVQVDEVLEEKGRGIKSKKK